MNEKITKPGVVRRMTDKLQKGTRKHIAPEIVEKYRSIADKIKANRATINQRDRQQEKSRRRSCDMEI